MNDLKIEYIPLGELKPYEKNARLHTETDVAAIVNSIQEFGMIDPIGIWSDKNIIVEGHGRLMALKELGHETAPCIRLDHLSDEQRRAYALAHNKTAELSKWDFDVLDTELADLELDMTEFGFFDAEDIDWADVEDLSEDSYEQPEKNMLVCPHCGHIGEKASFAKTTAPAESEEDDE